MGIYYVHIRKWLSVIPKEQFLFVLVEEFSKHHEEVAQNILDFLHLRPIPLLPSAIRDSMDSCTRNSQDSVNYKANPDLHMRTDTRQMLELFYQPFNLLLAELINKKVWR